MLILISPKHFNSNGACYVDEHKRMYYNVPLGYYIKQSLTTFFFFFVCVKLTNMYNIYSKLSLAKPAEVRITLAIIT